MELLLLTLAVFFVYETAFSLSPWTLPPWLQPVLVYGTALGLAWPDWYGALAAAGGVGLLHVLVRTHTASPEPQVVRRNRETRIPTLP